MNRLMSAIEYRTPDLVVPDCAAAGSASVAFSRDGQMIFRRLKNKGLDEAMAGVVPRLEKPWHHFPQRVEG